MSEPKYPNIVVQLAGEDGNAFSILGKVQKAMKRNNVPETEITEWMNDAVSGDYDHLLQVCMEWITVK